MLKHVRYEITLDEISGCELFEHWGKNWKYDEEKRDFRGIRTQY